ncbi:MAG: hypothetical protein ABJC36_11420 [Gemmatimonadales bacterium]
MSDIVNPLEADRRPVVLVVGDEPIMRWLMTAALRTLDQPPPLLFVSGFMGGGELPGPFLAKPFGPDALLAAVRSLIATAA